MKRILHTAAFAAALLGGILLSASCNKDERVAASAHTLTVSFSAAPSTKASDTQATEGETRIGRLDLFIFRSAPGASSDGKLEVHRRANAAEVSAGLLRLELTPGTKHIYALANATDVLVEGVSDEESLKASLAGFGDNSRESFLMAGSPKEESVLVVGSGNRVDIELRRLVARISVERITADFSSLAVRRSDLRIRRIYLTYVPKRVRPVNGDVMDVFGTPREVTFDGKNYNGFYDYETPAAGSDRLGTAANGFYNPGVLRGGVVAINREAEGLTLQTIPSDEGWLYSQDASKVPADHSWRPEGKLYMYMYPNSSEQTFEERTYDFTTKLVIEAELNGEVCWYPIPIAHTQPNWAYTVNSITLTTKGSDDPNLPVSTKQLDLDITVRDWTTGEIIGSYNHPDDNNGFIF